MNALEGHKLSDVAAVSLLGNDVQYGYLLPVHKLK